MAYNVMRAVAGAYKTLKANKRLPLEGPFPEIIFGDRGVVHFDKRTYSIQGDTLSLYTLDGRIRVPMALGGFQRSTWSAALPGKPQTRPEKQGMVL